jgi:hypothetical protein
VVRVQRKRLGRRPLILRAGRRGGSRNGPVPLRRDQTGPRVRDLRSESRPKKPRRTMLPEFSDDGTSDPLDPGWLAEAGWCGWSAARRHRILRIVKP